MKALLRSQLPGIPLRRGKVRDVYDFGDRVLIVATDRISAFDVIMEEGIPDKGKILNQLSLNWFEFLSRELGIRNHLVSPDPDSLPLPEGTNLADLHGRSTVAKKADVIPFECVVRGYLAGSGWKDYQATGAVCGVDLPAGLQQASQLPEPIFTPATKAEEGHDENIPFAVMSEALGNELAERIRSLSIKCYRSAVERAAECGLILADTKLEFGFVGGELTLVDEVFTPDSSRYWPADEYAVGQSPPSFDKQFVRDYLEGTAWDKQPPPPRLPDEIVERTRQKYLEAYERLTGQSFVA